MTRLKLELARRIGIDPTVVSIIVGTQAKVGEYLHLADEADQGRHENVSCETTRQWDRDWWREHYLGAAKKVGMHRATNAQLVDALRGEIEAAAGSRGCKKGCACVAICHWCHHPGGEGHEGACWFSGCEDEARRVQLAEGQLVDRLREQPKETCLAHLEPEPCQTCAAYIAAGL